MYSILYFDIPVYTGHCSIYTVTYRLLRTHRALVKILPEIIKRDLGPVCSRGSEASELDKRMSSIPVTWNKSQKIIRCTTWFHSPQPPNLCLCPQWHHGAGRGLDCVWPQSVVCNSPRQGNHWAGRTSECWPRSESRGLQLPCGQTWSDMWNSLAREI